MRASKARTRLRAGLRVPQALERIRKVVTHFAVTYPRWEPDAGKPHVRICEGEAEWLSYSTVTGGWPGP